VCKPKQIEREANQNKSKKAERNIRIQRKTHTMGLQGQRQVSRGTEIYVRVFVCKLKSRKKAKKAKTKTKEQQKKKQNTHIPWAHKDQVRQPGSWGLCGSIFWAKRKKLSG
jgi:hypothetical protein